MSKLGHGSFGFVVMAQDITPAAASTSAATKRVAIKFERTNVRKSVLKLEIVILRQLQTVSPYVCRYYGCGRCPLDLGPAASSTNNNNNSNNNNGNIGGLQEYSYVVMELLGPNLSYLLKKRSDERFSLATTALLARQMFRGVRSLHELGYLHRDIKPSNFALALNCGEGEVRRRCFMIDFGLCRRYVSSHGTLRPARSRVGFRGTARYASLTAHQSKDLSRRDDLISLFYVLAEFVLGTLPWKGLKDKDEIARIKMKDTGAVVLQMPEPLQRFYESVNKLKFSDCPRYDYLDSLLTDLFTLSGQSDDVPYDWDIEEALPSIEMSLMSARNATSREQKSVTMTADTQQKPEQTETNIQPASHMDSPDVHVNHLTLATDQAAMMMTSAIDMNDNLEEHLSKKHSPKPPSESLKSPRKQFSARYKIILRMHLFRLELN